MRDLHRNSIQFKTDDDTSEVPPIFGNFFEGWTSLFSSNVKETPKEQKAEMHNNAEGPSPTDQPAGINQESNSPPAKRKNSVRFGREVASEILENDNVAHAIQILQQALDHLQMTQTEDEDTEEVSKIYSQILKSLCDPDVAQLVNEMSKTDDGNQPDIRNSVMWRLFTKVVESGYVLERDAHLAVVNSIVDNNHKSLALQAMYALPRREWDTTCYRTAVSLHLMQEPKQTLEAQRLLSDYGKPYLDIANPIAPIDLPPIRMEMPLMQDITEQDEFNFWMFYQAALGSADEVWHQTKDAYETKRNENLEALKKEQANVDDLAFEKLNIETRMQQMDRVSIDDDNTMIYAAIKKNQFEYGWQVYRAMGDRINDATPCIVMHLCWVAFRQIPLQDISHRTEWETRAWSVYSRFMCSEYLHPEQIEAPGFLHDILSICVHSPEVMVDPKARYTKTMSVYNLLIRLCLDKLLCDDRVLEPILCTLLCECKGSPSHIVEMCKRAFEIWDRKWKILRNQGEDENSSSSFSMVWGLVVLCLKSGNEPQFNKMLGYLLKQNPEDIPSSLLAPIQTFHDKYMCDDSCYFKSYMFRHMEFTDNDKSAMTLKMDDYGFLHIDRCVNNEESQSISTGDEFLNSENYISRTNINETQATNVALSVVLGISKQEDLVPKLMYYSTKKAKALIRHCLKRTEKQ